MLEMETTAVRPDFVPSTAPQLRVWPLAVTLFFFGLVWFEVVNHLKAEWSLNPQYGYGWAVPFLALFLLWQRWPERPSPQPPDTRALPIAIIFFCAFLFLPIRFIADANPDWRLLSWALAASAVTISICFVFLVGGTPWARYFAFPFLFFLVAVPWPVHFEEIVIQGLMRSVTAINVSLLNIIGVPALQHGNVIEVSSGLIGIEEACSGVRSLQATLMISLFLGELYSFTIRRRVLLVIIGAALAFVTNVARTAILVWVGANRGHKGLESWHDPAGLTILLVCLFGLWFVSLFLRRGIDAPVPSSAGHSKLIPQVSLSLVAALSIWLLLAEAGVQTWYGIHPVAANSRWLVSWPTSESKYENVPIAPEAESLLHYNEGGGASWNTADGHRWVMYFFRWLPGRTAARFVKIHRPDICLPASGLTLVRDNGIRPITVNGVRLPIRSYLFDDGSTSLHVFYCYWDARSSYESVVASVEEDWTPRGRLNAALRGRREVGAQMLEVVVSGYANDEEADAALQRQLAEIIRPG